jgi:hypothetical protein
VSDVAGRVVVGDVNDEGGAAAIHAAGADGYFHHTDVSVAEEVRTLMDRVIESFGRIDILFKTRPPWVPTCSAGTPRSSTSTWRSGIVPLRSISRRSCTAVGSHYPT